jgi:hypothetical protein
MVEITARHELDAALKEKVLLLAYMQKGCVPCASVSPLLGMLSGFGGFLTARVENTGSRWFTDAYGVDGSPTWLVFRSGSETARIDPAGKSAAELTRFFESALSVSVPSEAVSGALEEGRRQADYLESCLAELAFRKKETGEDLLLASIRIKVCRACLECGERELAPCVSAQIGHIAERLREQLRAPDGATEARQNALEKLPSLAGDYIRALLEVKARIAERENRE